MYVIHYTRCYIMFSRLSGKTTNCMIFIIENIFFNHIYLTDSTLHETWFCSLISSGSLQEAEVFVRPAEAPGWGDPTWRIWSEYGWKLEDLTPMYRTILTFEWAKWWQTIKFRGFSAIVTQTRHILVHFGAVWFFLTPEIQWFNMVWLCLISPVCRSILWTCQILSGKPCRIQHFLHLASSGFPPWPRVRRGALDVY